MFPKKAIFIGIILALAVNALASDEQDLRQTFGKIIFAHKLSTINHLALTTANKETSTALAQALKDQQLDFVLSDVEGGPISAIQDRKLSELVTLRGDRLLNVSHSALDVKLNNKLVGTQDMAEVAWVKAVADTRASYYTLKQIMNEPDLANLSTCTRYVSANVSANYKGQSAQWKGLYLLGCADGIHAIDNTMGEAVATFWNANVYPYALLQTAKGKNEAVRTWLRDNSSAGCQTKTVCF